MRSLTKKTKIWLAVIVGLVLVMLGIYLGVSFFFRSHFYAGTRINGIDCGKMTVQQVKEAIQEHVLEYRLTLEERGGNTEVITADQLGMTYVDDNSVEKLMEEQSAFGWIVSWGKNKNYETAAATTYDQGLIDGILDHMDCFQAGSITAPANASLQETDTGYQIVPEKQGNTLKREEVKNTVIESVDGGKTELDLEAADLYEKPSVLSTDEALISEMQQLNTLTSANLVYDFSDRQFTVDRDTIRGWLVKGGNGSYTLDESRAAAWVKQMAYETDTFGLEHTFKTSPGPTVTLARGGDYGWVINKDKTTQALVEAVRAGTKGNLEPVYLYKGIDRSTNDIGGTYVEICISQQRMWCYKDGVLVVDTPVVTGNHAAGYDTPSGCVWAIDAKKRDAHFNTYNVNVTFWLPFNGGVGIHDASWRSDGDYVTSTYETRGSHGCINTPFDAAEKIFNTVDIGYPVIVYYSTDQVVGPQPTKENTVG